MVIAITVMKIIVLACFTRINNLYTKTHKLSNNIFTRYLLNVSLFYFVLVSGSCTNGGECLSQNIWYDNDFCFMTRTDIPYFSS